uniref:UBX domain-containing protein 11 n=1 Tax=Sus scrofa TaxID=9823 RepID=A0A8W4FL60_PIG
MERFLGDYGLQWVGEPVDQEDSEDNERDWMTAKKFWKPGDSLVPPEVDFDRLLASLKDLSELVVDSDTQVTPVPSRVPHHALEPIPLKLYRNGIMMFDGPFRPFYAPSTQRCLRDILDGFFPSELQRLYPDGVPFKVSDLRDQVYPENGLDPFPGEGRVVGLQRIRKPWDRTEHPGSRMTAEKFLNRLPKFVIRQGEVIDIRGPIRDTLQVRPALAPPAFLGGFIIIHAQPTRVAAYLEAQVWGPEDDLDGEVNPSELFHCLLERMLLVRALSWDQRADGQCRGMAGRGEKSEESWLGVSSSPI